MQKCPGHKNTNQKRIKIKEGLSFIKIKKFCSSKSGTNKIKSNQSLGESIVKHVVTTALYSECTMSYYESITERKQSNFIKVMKLE